MHISICNSLQFDSKSKKKTPTLMNGTQYNTQSKWHLNKKQTQKKVHTLVKNAEWNDRTTVIMHIRIVSIEPDLSLRSNSKSEIKCTQMSWQQSIWFIVIIFTNSQRVLKWRIDSILLCPCINVCLMLLSTGHLELKVFHAFWHFHIFLCVSFFRSSFRCIDFIFHLPKPNNRL